MFNTQLRAGIYKAYWMTPRLVPVIYTMVVSHIPWPKIPLIKHVAITINSPSVTPMLPTHVFNTWVWYSLQFEAKKPI
jgi:hypothetical protein